MSGRRGPLYLGVDAGGSSTRWILRGPSGDVARGRLGPLSGLSFLGTAQDGNAARGRISELAGAVGEAIAGTAQRQSDRPLGIAAAVVGVTGLTHGDAAADAVLQALAAALGMPPSRVRVVDDTLLVYRSSFAPGEGVVVYAGTGSIAIHVAGDGVPVRVGGHGHLIDDAGGGFWIGRRALRTVLRRADLLGAPAEGALADAVYRAVGARDWPGIRARIYGGGRGEVAALVPAVREALDGGDPDAAAIVSEAGSELARLADAVMIRLGRPLPVALTGGAAGLGGALRRALEAGLPPAVAVRDVSRSPVEAAALWAAEDARDDAAAE